MSWSTGNKPYSDRGYDRKWSFKTRVKNSGASKQPAPTQYTGKIISNHYSAKLRWPNYAAGHRVIVNRLSGFTHILFSSNRLLQL